MNNSFAQGECPNCGHDWTAHGPYIANGEKICYQTCAECYLAFPADKLIEIEQNGILGLVRVDVCQACYDKITKPHPAYCLCDQCADDYYAMTGEMP